MRTSLLVLLLTACGGSATDVVSVTEFAQDDFGITPSMLYPTDPAVLGRACAWTPGQMQGEARALVEGRWSEIGPLTLPGGVRVDSAEAFLAHLDAGTAAETELAALGVNLALNQAGVYGRYADFGGAFVPTGSVAGLPVRELAERAGRFPGPDLVKAARALNAGFGGCPVEWFAVSLVDGDGDGVPAEADCDDADVSIGATLHRADFVDDLGSWSTTPQLGGNWTVDGESILVSEGGQQALLHSALAEGNVRIQAGLGALGTEPGCGFDCAECEDYVPEDCYTEADALALGILSAEVTEVGILEFRNSGAFDVCLNGDVMWESPGSQSVFVSQVGGAAVDVRVPAGGSAVLYYGTWTTDNGTYSPYLGEDAFWCYQEGTVLVAGNDYSSIGAIAPDPVLDLIHTDTDLDGDGVEDAVDWGGSASVQDQLNIWEHQNENPMLIVGKAASDAGDGSVRVALTVQNRGAVAATGTLHDTLPQYWRLLGCDEEPVVVENADGSSDLSWIVELDGCTDDCAVVAQRTISCDIESVLQTDRDRVELPGATVDYSDTLGEQTGRSLPAVVIGYDRDADGTLTCGEIDRWRGGILGRAAFDEDQGEGYHGYRCAVARNAEEDCFDPGWFVQLGEFMDAPEDGISSECEDGCPPNTTFDSLDRTDTDSRFDLPTGATAVLSLSMLGDQLTCTATTSEGETATAEAVDESFDAGTVGLSTLNLWGQYDWLEVCEIHDETVIVIIDRP